VDPGAPTAADAYAIDASLVARRLGVTPAAGLAPEEVARRIAAHGTNAIGEAKREPLWKMIRGAIFEPFIVALTIAGLLAIAVGEVRDGILILVVLVPIIGADVATEFRAERALDALRAASAPMARVRRSGTVSAVAAAGLVPGDVVLLKVGDIVPADLRLLSVDGLLLDRSALTGESIPEAASVAPHPVGAPLTARRCMAYAGTSIVGGRGEGIVTAIGVSTEFGEIAATLASRERRRSPLQRELDRLVRILLVVAIGLIVVTFGAGFVRGNPLGANILAGVSAAIAAIPEEPPVLLAVILGLGSYRLLKRGVLVRRLNAEETLGAVDLIISDKTGTLTQNRLEVVAVRAARGDAIVEVSGAERSDLLNDALRAEDDAWAGDASSLGSFSRALVAALSSEAILPDRAELVASSAPSHERPYALTAARRSGTIEELALGAPEVVVGLVDAAASTAAGVRERWLGAIDVAAEAGERLVALAVRRDGGAWSMRALIGFADPIRPEIASAMSTAASAGIQVIVVTGDHPRTAAAIARKAGLAGERIVTGEELATWSDERLAAELPTLHIVARSTPQQKLRLVRAARTDQRVVAVLGDGVNDAPALHGADVAVSMGSGTAVAREASDLVLGDDSFATLVYALGEGRRIVDNVQKGLIFIISTHVAFLLFILLATLVVSSAQVLLPLQILWMELFIDLSTSVAFERERAEPDVMRRPPRDPRRPLLSAGILANTVVAGGFTAIAAIVVMLNHDGNFAYRSWLAYTILVVSQCVRAYWNRSARWPIRSLAGNSVLLAACVFAIGIQVFIPIVPPLADLFHAQPIALGDWPLIAVIALAPAIVAEVVRGIRRGATIWVA
jgi:Ca2+-transporting ATPase